MFQYIVPIINTITNAIPKYLIPVCGIFPPAIVVSFVTVTIVVAVLFPTFVVIVAVPSPIPFTVPSFPTVATDVLLLS